ncbi:MAG TPA: ABC transporter substrate-binding protein, partial [Thermomicrobiales bacterium]|nr:ABC transporter substrate-binding protein [Thermomicrobiales bacterium]
MFMNRFEIDNLVEQFRSGNISRRGFMRRATALGVSAAAAGMLIRDAAAQTPEASPAGTGEVVTNDITREEAQAQIDEAFPFEEPASEGGQIVHVMTTDISTVNTVLVSDTYSGWIANFIYDGLIGASVVDGREIPTGLADGWEIAEDGVTYTIFLKEGIKWHDGEDFNADDVIMTFEKALAEDSQSVRKATIDEVLESFEKVDDYTVKFVAKFQTALFLSDALSQFGIMPEHIWGDVEPA